ncbi:MAG: amidase family protein [Gammaproteobacteria bacterium]|nr:amidase family protein [Gammaproteobacteria bacterium]
MSTVRDLAFLPAVELARLVAGREVSAEEVVSAALDRIGRHNPVVNAVVTLSPRALDDARAIDRRLARGEDPGPLAGVPVGIKDMTAVAGLRTTYGSPLYADHVPAEDALVVRRLRAAGAVVVGKTNTPELAAGANTFNGVFGATRNPWDPALSAGGSTGGGAAGLATGMFALAEGTDLGGSLRIPAAFCGVSGLRPSPGLVPTEPTDWVWDTIMVTGLMARSAEDLALGLAAIAGPSAGSPLRQPVAGRDFPAAARAGVAQGARVAYCADLARIGMDAGVEAVCREAAFALGRAGAAVEEIDLDLSHARRAFLHLRGRWMVAHHQDRLHRIDELGPNLAGNIRAGLATTAGQLGRADRVRSDLWHRFARLRRNFDYLLTPTTAVPPFPVDQSHPTEIAGRRLETYVDWFAPTFVLSLTGLPVASVPAGLDSRGLPVGLQVVGPPAGEEAVLALAATLERLRPPERPSLAE